MLCEDGGAVLVCNPYLECGMSAMACLTCVALRLSMTHTQYQGDVGSVLSIKDGAVLEFNKRDGFLPCLALLLSWTYSRYPERGAM